MGNKIKVLRLHGPGDLRLSREEVPSPVPGQPLLKVMTVGLCGSDLHWFREGGIGDAVLSKPLVLGHEFAGLIVEGERKGERVAVDPAIPCRRCTQCQRGHPNLCLALRFAGHGEQDGALREFMTWPESCLFRLPESISMAEAAMLEPLGVALHAVDLAKIRIGDRVGVFGCGPIGLLIIQLLASLGTSQILATEILPHRLDAAREFGASDAYHAHDIHLRDKISNTTEWEGLDACFEVAGENDAVETSIAAAKPGGRVVLVGIPSEDRTAFTASTARRKGLTIKLCRRMKHTYPRAIQLVESGQVNVAKLVTHQYRLDDFEEAIGSAVRREGLKIVIDLD